MDKNFLQDILKKLKKKGAEEADVVFSSSKNKSSSCRLGEIEKTEESVTNEIGIRVIIKKGNLLYQQRILNITILIALLRKLFKW